MILLMACECQALGAGSERALPFSYCVRVVLEAFPGPENPGLRGKSPLFLSYVIKNQ